MTDEPLQVSIRIMDKDYRIACPQNERDDLRASAQLLDHRMREIRQTGRVIGTDRIAVMAALNIAHELIQLQRATPLPHEDDESGRRLRQLQERVSSALATDTPANEPQTHKDEPAEIPVQNEGVGDEPTLDASGERV